MHLNVDVRQFWAVTVELAENASHPRSNTPGTYIQYNLVPRASAVKLKKKGKNLGNKVGRIKLEPGLWEASAHTGPNPAPSH